MYSTHTQFPNEITSRMCYRNTYVCECVFVCIVHIIPTHSSIFPMCRHTIFFLQLHAQYNTHDFQLLFCGSQINIHYEEHNHNLLYICRMHPIVLCFLFDLIALFSYVIYTHTLVHTRTRTHTHIQTKLNLFFARRNKFRFIRSMSSFFLFYLLLSSCFFSSYFSCACCFFSFAVCVCMSLSLFLIF